MRALLLVLALIAAGAPERLRFTDDFEGSLDRWTLTGSKYIRTADSGDPAHKRVLVLDSGGDVLALVEGSERFGAVRLEGDVMFPTDENNYLGVVYHHEIRAARHDFGLVYIKGNDSYLQANPHRDWNVSRTLYPEHRAPLKGVAAIRTGQWQHFKVEVSGGDCHFYVGDMATPQLTFPLFEGRAGAVGLQPRSVGGPVWVDNVLVTSIDRLAYSGEPRPGLPAYAPRELLGSWQAIGPFDRTHDAIVDGSLPPNSSWQPFDVDARGAVVTGRIVDYHGTRTVAYFRTSCASSREADATLHFSTVDDLAIWVNGRFQWFLPRAEAAWFDFWSDPKHKGQQIPVTLKQGSNEIVIRVRGGVYASGGFFARLELPGGK
jgi:hypothetical protein